MPESLNPTRSRSPRQCLRYVWLLPLFGSFIWAGTLLAMLITWLASGQPRYVSQDGSIAYISDVGADILKPLFVAGCAITAASFFLSQCVEIWLRSRGRLHVSSRRRAKWLERLAIFSAFVGGCGLILLAVFDTKRYMRLHRVFLLVFLVGVTFSAIFSILVYRYLHKEFKDERKIKWAYVWKGGIAFVLIILAIAFAACLFDAPNPGAILEWVIAFAFTAYMITYVYDLRMANSIESGDLEHLQGGSRTSDSDPTMRQFGV